MSFGTWDEIRTAYHVARIGTVSGAAEALGVHHATVIRHVDALEARLGVKLFQRHARGYTATEAGQDLLRVAQATDDQFQQLVSRVAGRGAGVSGELVVTSVPDVAQFLTASLVRFQALYPEVTLRYVTDTRLLRLEYGEAHVALRAGTQPQEPDNVVQAFGQQKHGLYAARTYVEAHGGLPDDLAAPGAHRFVGSDISNPRVPFLRWLHQTVPAANFGFRGNDTHVLQQAVIAGAGIGFLPLWRAQQAGAALVEVAPPRDDWSAPFWLVTHVDLHRTAKVRACVEHLKSEVADWPLG